MNNIIEKELCKTCKNNINHHKKCYNYCEIKTNRIKIMKCTNYDKERHKKNENIN